MKNNKLLLAALTAFTVILSSCGLTERTANTENTEERTTTSATATAEETTAATTESTTSASETATSADTVDLAGLSWAVEPTFEYESLFYCPVCDNINSYGENIGIQVLDEKTLLPIGVHDGHGGAEPARWVYDPERELFGIAGYGMIEMHPIGEFANEFSEYADETHVVYIVDSTNRYFDEYFNGDCFAEFGKCALARGNTFVTDFVYDCQYYGRTNVPFFALGKDDKYGITDVPFFALGKDGKCGITDENGEVIIPFVLDEIVIIDKDTAAARYNGKCGIVRIP